MSRSEDRDYQRLLRAWKRTVSNATRIGGPWDYSRSAFWNRAHGRIQYTPAPTVPVPAPRPPSKPPSVPNDTPSLPDGKYGRILHDFEICGFGRPELLEREQGHDMLDKQGRRVMGFPEVVPALDWRMIPMPEKWQWFWFELIQKANPMNEAELVNLFRKVTRSNAFKTNKAGAESGYCNFVTGENLGAPPIKTGVLLTGGAMVKIIGEGRAGGVDGWKVAALDIDKNPPSLDTFDGLHQTPYIYFATTSQRGGKVIPLTGGPNIPTPSVTKGKDWILIDKRRVKLLSDNTPPDPYLLDVS